MNSKELTEIILQTASTCPLVHSVGCGDVYDELNNIGHNEYGHFNAVVESATKGTNLTRYDVVMYFADRLTQDKKNSLSVQVDGYTAIITTLNRLLDSADIEVGEYSVNYFEQKFADYCAGAWARVQISAQDDLSACDWTQTIPVPEDVEKEYKRALDEVNGTSAGASVLEKIDVTSLLRDELAQNLREKGQPVEAGDGLTQLVPRVRQIVGGGHIIDEGIEWYDDTPQLTIAEILSYTRLQQVFNIAPQYLDYSPLDYIKGIHIRRFPLQIRANMFNATNSQSSRLIWIIADETTGLQGGAFTYQNKLKMAIFPKCTSFQTPFTSCGSLEQVELGVLTTFAWGSTTQYKADKLRLLTIGGGSDVNIPMQMWTATNVIAEGKASQLELIANAKHGIAKKVYDHSADGQTRTITIGWVATLANDTDTDVIRALDDLADTFNAKGWTLS